MTLTVKDSGTSREITRAYVRQGGALRTIREIKVLDGGTLRTVAVFADPLSVTASGVSGNGTGTSSQTVTTTETTAIVSGGFAPYTYSWTLFTNDGGTPSTAISPTSASTRFQKANVAPDATWADIWQVTVTDAVGGTATAAISAQFSNFNFGGSA